MDLMDTQYENIDFSNQEISFSEFIGKTFKKCKFTTKFTDCKMTDSEFADADCTFSDIAGGAGHLQI